MHLTVIVYPYFNRQLLDSCHSPNATHIGSIFVDCGMLKLNNRNHLCFVSIHFPFPFSKVACNIE